MRLLIILILGIVTGCGVPKKDFDSLKEEIEKLKSENESLKLEIDEIKNGPDRLMNQTKSLQSSKEYSSAKSVIDKLISKHKGSAQEPEAKRILIELEKEIENQKIASEKQYALKLKQEEQKRLAEERKEKLRLSNATKNLRTRYDKIKGITWYYDKSTPRRTDYNHLHLYIGKEKDGKPRLRFRVQYTAYDWLFIESYIVKTDNGSHTIYASYGDVETDTGNGGIWEWYDVEVNNKLYTMVKDIISSKTNKLRYEGKQYYSDRTITSAEKQGLKNVLDAYEGLLLE